MSTLSPPQKRRRNDLPPAAPVLALTRDGTICSLTRAGRQVLEYGADDAIDDSFFEHVHGRNMRRVMQDLADMVCRGKRRARWLLRLRTGNQRWRWYRAFVQNQLGTPDERILVRLRPL